MSREEWLEVRRQGLGGSDASAVAGLNRWRSPLAVFYDKTQGEPVQEENEFMYWGNKLEQVVADEFAKRTGLKIRKKNAILQSIEYPFMLANVDRLIVGVDEGLECKTASAYKLSEWSEGIPWEYELQCHHYMAVTGYKAWWIAVLIGGNQFVFKRIERNNDIINQLIEIELKFWNEHVVKNFPPEPLGTVDKQMLNELYPVADEIEIPLPYEAEKLIEQRDNLKATLDELTEQKDAIENKIKSMLGEAELGYVGNIKVTWKNVSSKRIDSKKLKSEKPEIFEQYAKESNSRRFDIKREDV